MEITKSANCIKVHPVTITEILGKTSVWIVLTSFQLKPQVYKYYMDLYVLTFVSTGTESIVYQ